MSGRPNSVGSRALDTAVDLLFEQTLAPPATPSISKLCKIAGIGASTFYRLYTDVNEFREELVLHQINSAYADGDTAATSKLEDETTEPEPPPESENNNSADEGPPPPLPSLAERAAVLGEVSKSFFENGPTGGAIDADYFPWLDNPAIANAIADSFHHTLAKFLDIADSYIAWTGRQTIDTANSSDVMLRIMSLSVSSYLIPTSLRWSTAADPDVSLVTYLQVLTVEAMGQAPDSEPETDENKPITAT